MTLHKIQCIRLVDNAEIELTYDDNKVVVYNFSPIIQQGGVFGPLADTDFFKQVSVSNDGRYITWPGDIDFCADALRQSAATTVTG